MAEVDRLLVPVTLGILIAWLGFRALGGKTLLLVEAVVVMIVVVTACVALLGASALVGLLKLCKWLGSGKPEIQSSEAGDRNSAADSPPISHAGFDSPSFKELVEYGDDGLLGMWWKPPAELTAAFHHRRATSAGDHAAAQVVPATDEQLETRPQNRRLHDTLWIEYFKAQTANDKASTLAIITDLDYGEQPACKN